jgi:hypothetical protein
MEKKPQTIGTVAIPSAEQFGSIGGKADAKQ